MYDNAETRKESKVLFLGSLPDSFTTKDLESLLSEYNGVEKCFVISNKRCAIAVFASDNQASEALEELNSKEIEGKAIFVSYANKKRE